MNIPAGFVVLERWHGGYVEVRRLDTALPGSVEALTRE
jgi:hypothetical protein